MRNLWESNAFGYFGDTRSSRKRRGDSHLWHMFVRGYKLREFERPGFTLPLQEWFGALDLQGASYGHLCCFAHRLTESTLSPGDTSSRAGDSQTPPEIF